MTEKDPLTICQTIYGACGALHRRDESSSLFEAKTTNSGFTRFTFAGAQVIKNATAGEAALAQYLGKSDAQMTKEKQAAQKVISGIDLQRMHFLVFFRRPNQREDCTHLLERG